VTINGNSHVISGDALLPINEGDPKKVGWRIEDITPDLVLGPNVMTVQAQDGDMNNFNESAVKTIHFTFIEKHDLTVVIDGSGTVTEGFEGTSERKPARASTSRPNPLPVAFSAAGFQICRHRIL
jgi:hypothetical protein